MRPAAALAACLIMGATGAAHAETPAFGGLSCLVPIRTPTIGSEPVYSVKRLPGAGLLVAMGQGLYYVDAGPQTADLHDLGIKAPGFSVTDMFATANGAYVFTTSGAFSVIADPAAPAHATATPVGDVGEGKPVGALERADGGTLLAMSDGIYAISAGGRSLGVVHSVSTGPITAFAKIGDGAVVGGRDGVFLVSGPTKQPIIRAISGDSPTSVDELIPLAGGSLLAIAENGAFSVNRSRDRVTRLGATDPGEARWAGELAGLGQLVQTATTAYLVRESGATVSMEAFPAPIEGHVASILKTRAGHYLVRASTWYLASYEDGRLAMQAVGNADTFASVLDTAELAEVGTLLGTGGGLEMLVAGKSSFERVPSLPAGAVENLREIAGFGVLAGTKRGLFTVRREGSGLVTAPVPDPPAGEVLALDDLPEGKVLVVGSNGLFSAGAIDGRIAVDPIGGPRLKNIDGFERLEPHAVLVHDGSGWFSFGYRPRFAETTPLGDVDMGAIWEREPLAPSGFVLGTDKGLYLAAMTPLAAGEVEVSGGKEIAKADPASLLSVAITISHPCAAAADRLGLMALVTSPDGVTTRTRGPVEATNGTAKITLSQKFDPPGRWSLQIVSTAGGVDRKFGDARQVVTTRHQSATEQLETFLKWSTALATIALVAANIGFFAAARYKSTAWTIVTDEALGAAPWRIGTIAVSHVAKAQLWILDLYFRTARGRPGPAGSFLPLTLSERGRPPAMPADALAPPWTGQRFWIQGSSGMGKTALFRNVVDAHFRDCRTSFAARATWGCVLVAFAARDFAAGEDAADPTWVLACVRSTLSSRGLTLSDGKLLERMLRSGTIGVAIDGLNEAQRSMALHAFANEFPKAPMLVTSQESGTAPFRTLHLPPDFQASVDDLLRLRLGDAAARVIAEISGSGLRSAIRSGYEVELLAELAEAGGSNVALPADRLHLYASYVDAAWPRSGTDRERRERYELFESAWRKLSDADRDRRRFKPGADLNPSLLLALAQAPEREGTALRLMRRAGAAYELVHDQMLVYLAARWFTKEDATAREMEKLCEGSAIWLEPPVERRPLLEFIAGMLDDELLAALVFRIEEKEDWDSLRRVMLVEAERRRIDLRRMPTTRRN